LFKQRQRAVAGNDRNVMSALEEAIDQWEIASSMTQSP
jgi:hypothetical protein